MAKFAYYNIKNINTSHILFNLKCSYNLYVSFKDDINPYIKDYLANKLDIKLRNQIFINQENLLHIQEKQK